MTDQVRRLVDSLLYEGYALYPYTPEATKNATPTPFGIVYPPAYARELPSAHDHLELRCALRAPADALVRAELHFLAPHAERHRAHPESLQLPGAMVGALDGTAAEKLASFPSAAGGEELAVWLGMWARRLAEGLYELVLRVENRTLVRSGLDRARALARSLLSTHPVLRVRGGTFVSPLEHRCHSVNTFPVLAGARDDAVVGAAIVLPDHPEIAPESRGGLFDSTEIEEALLLHVQTLSDAEREQIEAGDPAVSEMVARAAAATPEEIIALHGRVTLRDPQTDEPPAPPPGLTDPRAGEDAAEIHGVTFRRGDRVRIVPGPDADLEARMLAGRSATLERIFTAYDGKVHFGVTIDDDPAQQLMRDTGRYRYFFGEELEVIGK